MEPVRLMRHNDVEVKLEHEDEALIGTLIPDPPHTFTLLTGTIIAEDGDITHLAVLTFREAEAADSFVDAISHSHDLELVE